MASILKVDTLTGVSTAGSISVTGEGNSTTTNLQQGLAKAYAHAGSSGNSLGSSLNVSSLADEATGLYSITFTNNMSAVPAAHYSDALSIGYNNDPVTASVVKSQSYNTSYGATDSANVYYTVHGDLA